MDSFMGATRVPAGRFAVLGVGSRLRSLERRVTYLPGPMPKLKRRSMLVQICAKRMVNSWVAAAIARLEQHVIDRWDRAAHGWAGISSSP